MDRPEIIIACSHRQEADEGLRAQAVEQLGTPEEAGYELYFVDSLHRGGELKDLKQQVQKAMVTTIERQGMGVPAHWEVAQEMAKGWLADLQTQDKPALEKVYTTVEKFGNELKSFLKGFLAVILLYVGDERCSEEFSERWFARGGK